MAWAHLSDASRGDSLERYYGYVLLGRGPNKDPGCTGEALSLICPERTLGCALGQNWRKFLSEGGLPPQPNSKKVGEDG